MGDAEWGASFGEKGPFHRASVAADLPRPMNWQTAQVCAECGALSWDTVSWNRMGACHMGPRSLEPLRMRVEHEKEPDPVASATSRLRLEIEGLIVEIADMSWNMKLYPKLAEALAELCYALSVLEGSAVALT